MARTLSRSEKSEDTSDTTAPSNCVPVSRATVRGEKACQATISQVLVAMKREMPDPRP